jgi:hypothetical protein
MSYVWIYIQGSPADIVREVQASSVGISMDIESSQVCWQAKLR